jgi:tRNA threonylcarbamoyladenosine biosynthesis protein TsaE
VRDPEAPLEDARFALAAESPARTEAIGEAWGRAMRGGESLLLTGDLGAGKTTLVRGLARGLGVAFGVKSPTFAILLSYPGRLTLHHVDLYRLADARDVEELGLDDLFSSETVTVVEWGERLGALAPAGAVRITLRDAGPEARTLDVRGPRATVVRLAEAAGASIEETS